MLRTALPLLLLLLTSAPLQAQQVTPRGDAATFDVATWNVEWFGSSFNGPSDDARQLGNVQAVIEQSGIELWGLQEISDDDDFEALLTALGDGYDGYLATNSPSQRIAFVWRTDAVEVRSIGHVLETFEYDFAFRPPLQLEATVTVGGTSEVITLIVLHMKANTGSVADQDESYDRRESAAQRLKNHIDFTGLRNEPVIILGDFNDELGRSIFAGRTTPYDNFLQDPDDYRFLSLPLDEADVPTYCGNSSSCSSGSTLDHILVTDELFGQAVETDRYGELTSDLTSYVFSTSDHLPVLTRFDLGTNTATEDEGVLPGGLSLTTAYPNPFTDAAELSFSTPTTAPVTVEVFDVLGRPVATPVDATLPAGTHTVRLDGASWSAGLYLVRLQTPTATVTRTLVRAAR